RSSNGTPAPYVSFALRNRPIVLTINRAVRPGNRRARCEGFRAGRTGAESAKAHNKPYVRIASLAATCHDHPMPRVSQDQLDARRHESLAAARECFARHGYEGATVRRLEEATGLSRGAIFHHFRDKESLFLAVAEDDAAAMVETVARNGLVQVMRDLL